MDEWRDVRVYDEAGFDHKLRREARGDLHEETAAGFADADELLRGQLEDLIEGLPLAPRYRDLLRMRLDGWTMREIAEQWGVSFQRVACMWRKLRCRLPEGLEAMEAQMVPGRVPHYGWQEVYLDSVRRPSGAASDALRGGVRRLRG